MWEEIKKEKAIAVTWRVEGKVPTLPLVTGVFVLVFGGLTLILQDELFIKLKPTIVNTLFGLTLLGAPIVAAALVSALADGGVWARAAAQSTQVADENR